MSTQVTFLIILLFIYVIPVVHVDASPTIFSLRPDNVCYEVWGGFNDDAVGESYYDTLSEKFVMWINDTSGSWGLAKLSRGIMPHYWGLRYAQLDNEFEIERGRSYEESLLILEIDLKLVNYANYTLNNSSTNVAVVLFFDGFKTDYQAKCYQTELQFFSYYGDKIQKNQVWFFEWRNDSVAQFKLADNLQPGEYKHYRINLIPYIQQMMDYYKLDHAKLKHIEIFTEAYNGYCKFEVYCANIHIEGRSFFHLAQLQIVIGAMLLICFIFLIFYRRAHG
ncbi:MAG: hypothetical protein QXZ28_02155 [Candidatus Methanomethylicaceae archaeon]|nr:hypothetical protein [Candidatus Verstraetearchaeota archaeon]